MCTVLLFLLLYIRILVVGRADENASAFFSVPSWICLWQVMDQYRSGEVRLLVATDVAARGLDVKDISYVINYDFPVDGVEVSLVPYSYHVLPYITFDDIPHSLCTAAISYTSTSIAV